jgi:type II secretion system protein N
MKLPTVNWNWRQLRWVAYGFAYLFTFVLFAYFSFPYERLKQYVVTKYNASQLGATPDHLEIESLGWSWHFPGIVAHNVRLTVGSATASGTSSDTPQEGDHPAPPPALEAEHVYVSLSPLALLGGVRAASFGASALGGQISGSARDSNAMRRLDLTLDGINPGGIPQLAAAIGLPLTGRLSGHVAVDLPDNNVLKAEGNVDLAAEDLVLGDGKAKIGGAIALPELHMGQFKLKAAIAAGRLKIDECAAQGRDIDLSLTGGLRLRKQLESSLAELELKFSFSDKYKTQSELTRALFGQPDSKIPGLFDTATTGMLSKQEDGSYGARLYGPFDRLKPRPANVGRRPVTTSGSTPLTGTARRRPIRSARRTGRPGTDNATPEPAEESNDSE